MLFSIVAASSVSAQTSRTICQSLRTSALFARLSCLCGSALLMLLSLLCSDFRVPQSFPVDGHPGPAGSRGGLPRRTVRGSVNSRTGGCWACDCQLRALLLTSSWCCSFVSVHQTPTCAPSTRSASPSCPRVSHLTSKASEQQAVTWPLECSCSPYALSVLSFDCFCVCTDIQLARRIRGERS
jgi:hypothetical protein